MKYLFLIVVIISFYGCESANYTSIYKKGDIICTKLDNTKGIVIWEDQSPFDNIHVRFHSETSITIVPSKNEWYTLEMKREEISECKEYK